MEGVAGEGGYDLKWELKEWALKWRRCDVWGGFWKKESDVWNGH